MTCPPEVAAILADILTWGLLQIRNGELDPALMQAEADHLHNLPTLLVDYDPKRLDYYWDVERPSYLRLLRSPKACQVIEGYWAELEPCVRAIRDTMDRDEPDDTR